MRARTMLVGWTVALAVSTACAAQTGVRAIHVMGLNLGDASGGSVEAPVLLTNIDELYNTIIDEQAIVAITAQVDFSKENLLYFRWEGSGQDSLTPTIGGRSLGREVTFVFRPGVTLELSPHHHLFVIPRDASWRVEVVMPAPTK